MGQDVHCIVRCELCTNFRDSSLLGRCPRCTSPRFRWREQMPLSVADLEEWFCFVIRICETDVVAERCLQAEVAVHRSLSGRHSAQYTLICEQTPSVLYRPSRLATNPNIFVLYRLQTPD